MQGTMRGGQPAWTYLRDFSFAGKQKKIIISRLLARLPGSVSFHFVFNSDLPDAALVRQAFYRAGFKILDWTTYIYAPPDGHADIIDSLAGKSIKGTLRRARRDLELVQISARDYFRFQRANLAASHKKNNRIDNLDQLNLEQAVRQGCALILGARRKSTDSHPGPHPLDAACVCLWDESSGPLILWRMTYRAHSFGPLMPHVDASKLLILAAMEEAAKRKKVLDTDGYTPGMAKLYAMFGPGVFRRVDRLHCERETLKAILNRHFPSFRRIVHMVASFARRFGGSKPHTEVIRPISLPLK